MDGGTCTFSNAQSSLPRGKLSIETREGSGASTWEYEDGTSKSPFPGLGASKGFDFKYLMEQLFSLLRLNCLLSLAIDKSVVRPRVAPL